MKRTSIIGLGPLVLSCALLPVQSGCVVADDEPEITSTTTGPGTTPGTTEASTGGAPDPSAGSETGPAGGDSSSGNGNVDDSSGEPAETSTGAVSNPDCPAGAVFCDDFEGHALGDAPGAPWAPEGSGTAVVDTEQAFSGTQAVHLGTTAGFAGRSLLGLAQAELFPTAHLFGRMRMYLVEASPDGVHWTMVQASGPTTAPEVWDGPFTAELRYGGQHQQRLMANYETPGTYASPPEGPASDCWQHSQTAIPQGEWTCMEWEFDGEAEVMRLWFDGEAVADIEMGTSGEGCVNPGTNGTWYYPEMFEQMQVGWVDYQDFGGERELWIDDVAVGFDRIGCED